MPHPCLTDHNLIHSFLNFGKIMQVVEILLHFVSTHFDDRWDFGIDVVIGKMEAHPEGTFVQQWVLIKLNLATGIALVQTHSAVSKVDHFPQDQLWS